MIKVDNAIILAAGTATRFAPLSYEKPKCLYEVKGEVLIERQIRQLKEAGINEIYIVVGYKFDLFNYLVDKYQVKLIYNSKFDIYNNLYSLILAKQHIKNSYICSSDNYFNTNPFNLYEESAFYSAIYQKGKTNEWSISFNENNIITDVKISGHDSWVMMGHVFWDNFFSLKFFDLIESYGNKVNLNNLWENIYIENIKDLTLKIKKYDYNQIFEFDSLDELREFDNAYISNTKSKIIKDICMQLNCKESDINEIVPLKESQTCALGIIFNFQNNQYKYMYSNKKVEAFYGKRNNKYNARGN